MFRKTRNRLTISFSLLMILFLFMFITVTYFWLSAEITKDQKEAVKQLADIEVADHRHELLEWMDEQEEWEEDEYEGEEEEDSEGADPSSVEYRPEMQVFYYVFSKDGRLIDGDINDPRLSEQVPSFLGSWKPESDETRYKSFQTENNKVEILFAGRPVYENGVQLGTIFTGTDVTAQQNVLSKLLWVLIPLSLVFVILSAFLGHFMASRAMVPISMSFDRQKQFAADASHELRTPLSVIQSSIEVIEAENNRLSAFSLGVLKDMKEEVKRMIHLTSDMLTLARSDSGMIELQYETFDLVPVLEYTRRSFEQVVRQREIKLETEVPVKLLVHADKERMTQLLFILTDNAVKYNRQGGSVKLKAVLMRNQLKLEVSDTGIGMPEEELSHIFDRFYRIEKARSRGTRSSGIGLSIAEWIVAAHGGKIIAESKEGAGSTFTVTIPQPKKEE